MTPYWFLSVYSFSILIKASAACASMHAKHNRFAVVFIRPQLTLRVARDDLSFYTIGEFPHFTQETSNFREIFRNCDFKNYENFFKSSKTTIQRPEHQWNCATLLLGLPTSGIFVHNYSVRRHKGLWRLWRLNEWARRTIMALKCLQNITRRFCCC